MPPPAAAASIAIGGPLEESLPFPGSWLTLPPVT